MASDFNLFSDSNKVIFTIKDDGNIELGPGMTPDEASRAFWELLSASNPLQQQLAQARLANEMLRQDKFNAERQLGDLEGYNAQVEAQNAAMRALLTQAADMCGDERWTVVNTGAFLALAEEIRALLAEHPKE